MTESKLPARAWLTLALLWVVSCLNYLDRVMITTMHDSLTEAIPMTDAQFGLLTTVFLFVYGGLSPFAGFLADRFKRSHVIVGSLFVWSLVTWLTAHAKNIEQLLATRALMGISEACFIPAGLALIADYHRGATRALATGILLSGTLVGAGLGGLGGWLAERHSWDYAFNLFGLLGVGYAVALAFLLRDTPRESGQALGPTETGPKVRLGEALVSLFSRGAFILALAYWGLLGLAGWAVVGWMPVYLSDHLGLPQGRAGLIATVYLNVASVIGMLIGGAWADRWSVTRRHGYLFVSIIGLCIAAPGIFLVANTSQLPLVIGGLVLYGLTRSFADTNMMPILCLISDPRYRATGFGLLNLFGCFVGGVTIYAGGALRDAQINIRHIFQFGAVGLLVCAALLIFIKLRSQPTR